MRIFSSAGLMLIFVIAIVAGCASETITSSYSFRSPNKMYNFVNKSAHKITVYPDGQDWQEFELQPEDSRMFNIEEDEIKFDFTHYDNVYVKTQEDGTIEFFDEWETTR